MEDTKEQVLEHIRMAKSRNEMCRLHPEKATSEMIVGTIILGLVAFNKVFNDNNEEKSISGDIKRVYNKALEKDMVFETQLLERLLIWLKDKDTLLVINDYERLIVIIKKLTFRELEITNLEYKEFIQKAIDSGVEQWLTA